MNLESQPHLSSPSTGPRLVSTLKSALPTYNWSKAEGKDEEEIHPELTTRRANDKRWKEQKDLSDRSHFGTTDRLDYYLLQDCVCPL